MIALGGQGNNAGDLMLSVTAAPSDYSYFDQEQVANWAGPKHWHLRPRSKGKLKPLLTHDSPRLTS